jgi:hypothetical protein
MLPVDALGGMEEVLVDGEGTAGAVPGSGAVALLLAIT